MSYLFLVSLGARSVTKKRKRSSSSTRKKRRYISKKLPRYPKISSLVRRPLKHKRGWPSRRNLLQMSWNSCSRKLTSPRSLSPRTFCSRLTPGNFSSSRHYQGFKLNLILLFRAKLPKTMSAPEKVKMIANDWQNAPDSVKNRYMEQQKVNTDRYVNSTFSQPLQGESRVLQRVALKMDLNLEWGVI